MNNIFLKVLAFLLGFKDQSPEEHAEGGRKIRLSMINSKLKTHIPPESIKEIYAVGAIEYSLDVMNDVKSMLLSGNVSKIDFPKFDPNKSYINFYQITTNDDRFYIYAMSDQHNFEELDDSLMMIEIKQKLPTSHLPSEARYK